MRERWRYYFNTLMILMILGIPALSGCKSSRAAESKSVPITEPVPTAPPTIIPTDPDLHLEPVTINSFDQVDPRAEMMLFTISQRYLLGPANSGEDRYFNLPPQEMPKQENLFLYSPVKSKLVTVGFKQIYLGGKTHWGVDYGWVSEENKILMVVQDSTVLYKGQIWGSRENQGSGPNGIILGWFLQDGTAVYAAYGHCEKIFDEVDVGDQIKAGQTIAVMGNRGYSFGTHLHLAIYVGGKVEVVRNENENPYAILTGGYYDDAEKYMLN